MASRSRIVAFGSAGILVVAGALCAVVASGLVGQLVALVLVSIGLAGATLLLFLEVGLSENRERAREAEDRRKRVRSGPEHPARRPVNRTPRR